MCVLQQCIKRYDFSYGVLTSQNYIQTNLIQPFLFIFLGNQNYVTLTLSLFGNKILILCLKSKDILYSTENSTDTCCMAKATGLCKCDYCPVISVFHPTNYNGCYIGCVNGKFMQKCVAMFHFVDS
ncbi:hypothetical protein KSF78_0006421 [Schistosoma japonicum]|nr:hypothetical protein KSF78_0006421 [Schistosoma japonicum]